MRSFQTVSTTLSFDSLTTNQQAHVLFGFIWIKQFKQVEQIKPSLSHIQLCITLSEYKGVKKKFLQRYQEYLNWTVEQYNKG